MITVCTMGKSCCAVARGGHHYRDCSLLSLIVLHVGVVVGTTFTTAYETDSSNQDYYTDALK